MALILTRTALETIKIGPNIEITICRVQGSRVVVAVEAPEDVKILRGELGDEDSERNSA